MIKSIRAAFFAALLFVICSCAKTSDIPYDFVAETEHFEIYCSQEDKSAFEALAKELEEYCRHVETDLDIDEPQKIKLEVYPDMSSFCAASGAEYETSGTLYANKGLIMTVSPSADNVQTIPAAAYQTSGILPYAIIKSAFDAPEYLLYGAAMLEGGCAFDYKDALKLAKNGFCDVKFLKKMTEDELDYNQESALCAYLLSDYIQSQYGNDAYVKLLNKPNTKSVLGVSDEELQEGCCEYIKKTYAKIPFDLQKETEHFKFYCESGDLPSIEDTVNTLEDNYERVTTDLQTAPAQKFDIVFYPSEEWFQQSAKSKGTPIIDDNQTTGFWYEGVIHLPSPAILTVQSNQIPNTALHEFVHAVTYELNPDPERDGMINTKMPKYLLEGIATYEAGGQAYSFMYANEAIRNDTFPTFEELETMNSSIVNPELYTWGSLLCEFIVKEHGQDKMVEILKTFDIEGALGKKQEDIRSDWIEYLKKEYKINI